MVVRQDLYVDPPLPAQWNLEGCFRTTEGNRRHYDEGESVRSFAWNDRLSRIMKQSPLLVFESAAFAIIPREDEQTNPGIYGKSLAMWLAEQLRSAGLSPGAIIAEDFGWCIPVDSPPYSLYVACAGTGEKPDHWRVFVFAEGGMISRLRGRDRSAEPLATLFAAVRRCIESAPDVRALREELT